MKNISLFLFYIFISQILLSQTTWGDSLTVRLSAIVNSDPPKITLNWNYDSDAEDYKIYRKLKTETTWNYLEFIPWYSNYYVDSLVEINTEYDYKVLMSATSTPDKYGYVSSGIDVQLNINKGICIVLTENSYISDTEFIDAYQIFKNDLFLEGWRVKEIFVSNTDAVVDVKNLIIEKYLEDPDQTKSLIILGHVPVPYSGNINPDGHPDHQGGWPTDMFYADIDGEWTDVSINNTTSSNSKNHNIPSDGKYDQSFCPSSIELETGRIDFFDMPAFAKSEKELLVQYLKKDHAFKHQLFLVNDKAIIDDNFTGYTEGFSQNGYRNFSSLVGSENISTTDDYFFEMSHFTGSGETYIWSYGCGGGWYQGASGVGDTYMFAADSLNTVFTMLFGSYFGDWDNSDAFLRAPLAQGNTLTNCWAGRPNWHFYPMAMGNSIGYCNKISQNNATTYFASTIAGLSKMVHMTLLGDPTLRMHYVDPPKNLEVILSTEILNHYTINWETSTSEIIGYNIYRKNVDSLYFEKLNIELVSENYFEDTIFENGNYSFLVTAVASKTTPSGRYLNESLGVFAESELLVSNAEQTYGAIEIFPNPTSDYVVIKLPSNEIVFEISVQDLFGNLLYNKKNVNKTQEIKMKTFPAGIYFVHIKERDFISTHKVIKL